MRELVRPQRKHRLQVAHDNLRFLVLLDCLQHGFVDLLLVFLALLRWNVFFDLLRKDVPFGPRVLLLGLTAEVGIVDVLRYLVVLQVDAGLGGDDIVLGDTTERTAEHCLMLFFLAEELTIVEHVVAVTIVPALMEAAVELAFCHDHDRDHAIDCCLAGHSLVACCPMTVLATNDSFGHRFDYYCFRTDCSDPFPSILCGSFLNSCYDYRYDPDHVDFGPDLHHDDLDLGPDHCRDLAYCCCQSHYRPGCLRC